MTAVAPLPEVDDVDELAMRLDSEAFLGHDTGQLRDVAADLGEFLAGKVGTIAAGLLRYEREVEVEFGALDESYVVALAVQGSFEVRVSGQDATVDELTGVIVGPSSRAQVRGWGTGTEQLFLLKFDRRVLETELGRLLGSEVTSPVSFAPALDLKSPLGGQWQYLAMSVMAAMNSPDGLPWNPMVGAQLASAISTGFLLASAHPHSDDLHAQARPMRPAVIQRAMTLIEERAHESLSVPDIAAMAGIGVRALQKGFRRYLGMTPGEYLTRVRMSRVHSELVAANAASTSVSAIASRWGFTHLSRFAAGYREIYGTLPSATLRER